MLGFRAGSRSDWNAERGHGDGASDQQARCSPTGDVQSRFRARGVSRGLALAIRPGGHQRQPHQIEAWRYCGLFFPSTSLLGMVWKPRVLSLPGEK